jgi:hypothetical protein
MPSAVGSALQRAEAVHEVEHIDQRVGDRKRPIDPSTSLFQRFKHNKIRSEIHAVGGEPQGFRQATARMREQTTQRPHLTRRLFGSGQEGRALRCGQIFPVSPDIIQPEFRTA